VDRVTGVAVGIAGTLVGCFLIAGLLASATWGSLAAEIQNSTILGALNKVMPPVPTLEAKVQSLFRTSDFPSIFASIVAPVIPESVAPVRLGPLVTSVSAPGAVVKVFATGGCSQSKQGTAFFVSEHDAVTNAHVVAGEKIIHVDGFIASVVSFDPDDDIAVLRVNALNETPLHFFSPHVVPGTRVRVVGFPLNATRTSAPGYFEGDVSAQGQNIYDERLMTRTYEVIEVNVQPGNSGSPVLISSEVAGVLESKSLSQPSTAYAIPDEVVLRDLEHASTRAVSTENCLP
jgi:S1-C subfamily serine protease